MLELWGMQSTPLLPSLPGPLWLRMVAPDKLNRNGLNRTKLHLCITELFEMELFFILKLYLH